MTFLEQVADRSPTSCSKVAERSPISHRPIADQLPTSFSDSHAPILTKLAADRSATSRQLIGDWSATLPGPVCDQINRSQLFCDLHLHQVYLIVRDKRQRFRTQTFTGYENRQIHSDVLGIYNIPFADVMKCVYHILWNLMKDWTRKYGVRTKVLTKCRCDLDLWTAKRKGTFLSPSCIYVWNMKVVRLKSLKLSCQNHSIDGQTDGRTDGRTWFL